MYLSELKNIFVQIVNGICLPSVLVICVTSSEQQSMSLVTTALVYVHVHILAHMQHMRAHPVPLYADKHCTRCGDPEWMWTSRKKRLNTLARRGERSLGPHVTRHTLDVRDAMVRESYVGSDVTWRDSKRVTHCPYVTLWHHSLVDKCLGSNVTWYVKQTYLNQIVQPDEGLKVISVGFLLYCCWFWCPLGLLYIRCIRRETRLHLIIIRRLIETWRWGRWFPIQSMSM